MRRRALVLLATLLALAAPAAASAATPRAELTDVEDEVMCVTCNVPLNVAESPQATQERDLIRRLIARGATKQEIKDELVAQYGPNVLAEPDDDGIGLFAWLVPIAAGVLLVALWLVLLPRWRARRGRGEDGHGPAPAGPALSRDDARRLDEDLARYDL